MNGHDHCAQFIDVGDGVQYHTIGSAHENNPDTSHKGSIPAGSLKFHTGKGDGGFSAVKVDSNGMAIEHRDGDGTLLYTAPAIPPRTFETNWDDDEELRSKSVSRRIKKWGENWREEKQDS